MGGRALKHVVTRRCSRIEFDSIGNELLGVLKISFSNVGVPTFYRKKESFGDIDIVISVEGFNENIREFIVRNFSPNEIFHNGNCWSFDYKQIQIDLVTTSIENFQSMLNYMGGNDLGNLIGRIAHGFGMKYGQEGLWLERQIRDQNIGTIPLSKDMRLILQFLDLSFEKYIKGFDTLEEIFEFISSSKYFNWKMFQLKELNKVNRDRNKKRTSYMSFLEWVEKNVADDNHLYEFSRDKTHYLTMIDEAFPEANLKVEIRRLEYENARQLYIKAKFNGGMIMKQYGIKDKLLGQVIEGFKNYVNEFRGDYEDFILNNNSKTILEYFDRFLFLNFKPIS